MSQLIMESFLKAFLALFVAIDALGALPFLVGLTKHMSEKDRKALVYKATISAAAIGLIFIFGGRAIFNFLAITESDFKVAGGLLLIVFAISDLLVSSSHQGAPAPTRVGIVPIAVPLMMGPAALATLMVGNQQYGPVITVSSLLLNLLIVFLLFFHGTWIVKKLGDDVSDAVNKVFSLLIAAIGVMLVRSGIFEMIAAVS
jgi:multiple antibiotic resistance protein